MDDLLAVTHRAEIEHFWFRGFRAFITPLLASIANGSTRLRILDCGCGTGNNLSLLQRFGNPVGLELTRAGIEMARGRKVPLVRGSITGLPVDSRTFDLVTSFDVLQLIEDDGQALREMARVLKPGGRAIITVSAFEILRGGHAAAWPEVRRYTRGSLAQKATAAGLQVTTATYMFSTLFPLMLAVRLFRRNVGDGEEDWEMRVPPEPVNAILSGLVRAEAAIRNRVTLPLPGSSVLLIATKSP